MWIDVDGFLSILKGANLTTPTTTSPQSACADHIPLPQSPALSPLPVGNEVISDTGMKPNRVKKDGPTRVEETTAIRIFLSAARQLRDNRSAPERCISFEHFLGCLRAICAKLDCPPAMSVTDAAHTRAHAQSDSSDGNIKFTSSRMQHPLKPTSWTSPLILRQNKGRKQVNIQKATSYSTFRSVV